MRFTFCPDCGSRLIPRDLGDDKAVPWCETCAKPWFDMFPTCVISLVYDDNGRVLLLRQNYISSQYANLVSGYMTPGETAEQAAVREITEETGLHVDTPEFVGTFWFQRKGMLMVGFMARAIGNTELSLSSEVDNAMWVDAHDAPEMVHPSGSVSHTLCDYFLTHKNPES